MSTVSRPVPRYRRRTAAVAAAAAAHLSVLAASGGAYAQASPPGAPHTAEPARAPAASVTVAPHGPASPPIAYDSVPVVEVKPLLIDFGRQLVYQSAASASEITITNRGSADLIISLISDPTDAMKSQDQFPLSKPQVYPLTIPRVDPLTQRGGTLTILANYRPTQAGPVNAIVEIFSNDSRNSRMVVNLHGEGVDTPIVAIVPESPDARVLDFGAFRIDPNRPALPRKTLTLKNVGPADVSISDATKKGITVEDFNIFQVIGRNQMGAIQVGREATVDVEFKVQSKPSVSTALAEFQVFGPGLKPVIMPMTAQTVDTFFTISTDEKSGDAGAAEPGAGGVFTYNIQDALGAPAKHTITISNATRYDQTVATIESDNPALVLENANAVTGATLRGGQSVNLNLRFEPRQLGTVYGTLTLRVKGVDGPDAELHVTATAIEPPLGGKGVACATAAGARGRSAALPITAGMLLASALVLRRLRRRS